MSENQINTLTFATIVAGGLVLFGWLLFDVVRSNDTRAAKPAPNAALVLAVDSCGCKVYAVQYSNAAYLVNTAGGIVRVE